MHVEVKAILESANDYYAVMSAMENRRLGEEAYRDCFFDFPNGALAGMNSLLRLRTPCLKPGVAASPLLASAAGGAYQVVPGASAGVLPTTTGAMGSFEEFLQSGTGGPSAIDEETRLDEVRAAYLATASGDSSGAQTALLAATFTAPQGVVLLPGQTGKLVLKQRNTVERGQQMSFVVEDGAVPASVVVEMIQSRENPFEVLCRYASTTPPESAARKIVAQLRSVAHEQQEKDDDEQVGSQGAEGRRRSDRAAESYEYVRYAAATATPPRSQEMRQRAMDGLMCALVCTGSYITTRTTFRYLHAGAAQLRQNLTYEEREMWENICLRLDATVYPFGERFEVEIPKIPAAFLDDVTQEVFSFMRHLNVHFHPASEGKYARFIHGVRSMHAQREDTQDIKIRLTSINGYNEVKQNLESIAQPPADISSGGQSNAVSAAVQSTLASNQRRITNLDVDRSHREGSRSAEDSIVEERHDNYFFDSPDHALRQQQCFLRLRAINGGAKYVLVLKEKQSFTEGQQGTRTQKTPLSGDIAEVLIANPTAFLQQHHESNAVANTLWNHFRIQTLAGVAHFCTWRLKVPWRAAQSQKYVAERSSTQMVSSSAPPSVQLFGTAEDNMAPTAVVPALVIHLDRTRFELPRAPVGVAGFTQHVQADFQTGSRTYEMYEVEVTNLMPTTSPSQVLAELTDALDWLGVEWQYGAQSKLDQFYALMESAATPSGPGPTSAASMLFDRWGMRGGQ